MKLVCDRAALLDAINSIAKVVPQRSPSPQLSCVKLVAGKATSGGGGASELTLAATDAETSLQLLLNQVDVSTPGLAAIPAEKLRQIISAEDGESTLTLEMKGEECHIRSSASHFRVFGFPATEYPPIPDLAGILEGKGGEKSRSSFLVRAGTLLTLANQTMFATARETSRYAINGVLLKRDGKKLEMVATDGRRLAVSRATLTGEKGGDSVTCIVPTKALNLITTIARDPDEMVRVVITDSRIFFGFEGAGKEKAGGTPRAVLSSTLVEGTFPPYDDVIPKEQDKKVVADRENLSRAIRKAAVLTNEESRGVRLAFSAADKRLTLSSRAPEMGDSEINVDLQNYEGENIEISFNPAFIADVLKVVDEPEVILELKAPNKPGILRSAAGEFLYVVMPVNLPQ